MNIKLNEKIKQAVIEAKLSQEKLAKLMNISQPAVNAWVTGKIRPTLKNLKTIAMCTNKPIEFFFELKNSLGYKINLAMYEADLIQIELSKLIGVAPSNLNHWINNKRKPRFDIICKIAKATNKPLSYFEEKED